jgi:osmotically-inducible protein OsmY
MEDFAPNSPQQNPLNDGKERSSRNEDGQALLDRIHQNLGRLGYAQLQNIRCIREGDEIVMTGSLDSFYLKQVALSVALKLPGVNNVRNEIQVT